MHRQKESKKKKKGVNFKSKEEPRKPTFFAEDEVEALKVGGS